MSAVEFQDADSIGFRAWWETRVHPPVDMGGAMATVYVAAGSGDAYRIARVYLDWTSRTASRATTTGWHLEPVDVEEWEVGAAVRL